jgi:hypothetical protein
LEKNTPGCFLYTDADAIAYVFLETREVHFIPMPVTRQWFLEQKERFPLRHTQTRMGEKKYTTVGSPVPCRTLWAEVPDIQRYAVDGDGAIHALPEPRVRRAVSAISAGGVGPKLHPPEPKATTSKQALRRRR